MTAALRWLNVIGVGAPTASGALVVGHSEQGRFIADVVRGRPAPHDPAAVTVEFAQVLKSYGLAHVTGDNYAGEWVVQAFHANGIRYERAAKSKSEIYLEAQPHWNRGLISVPNVSRLLRELRLLERRTHRSGRDTVDHGTNGSDDFANALCGCAWLALQPPVPNFVGLQYHFDEWRAKHARSGDAWNPNPQSPPCTVPLSEPHPQKI